MPLNVLHIEAFIKIILYTIVVYNVIIMHMKIKKIGMMYMYCKITCSITYENYMDNNKLLQKFVYVFLDESLASTRSKVCNNVFQDECIFWVDVLRTEMIKKIFSGGSKFIDLRRYAELSRTARNCEVAKGVLYLTDVHSS